MKENRKEEVKEEVKEELKENVKENTKEKFAFDNVPWKKIVIIGAMIVAGVILCREILFWSAFHGIEKGVIQQQHDVEKQFAENEKAFHEKDAQFQAVFDHIQKTVEDQQQEMTRSFDQIERESQLREQQFNQFFKEAPDKMLAAHDALVKKMEADFMATQRAQAASHKVLP